MGINSQFPDFNDPSQELNAIQGELASSSLHGDEEVNFLLNLQDRLAQVINDPAMQTNRKVPPKGRASLRASSEEEKNKIQALKKQALDLASQVEKQLMATSRGNEFEKSLESQLLKTAKSVKGNAFDEFERIYTLFFLRGNETTLPNLKDLKDIQSMRDYIRSLSREEITPEVQHLDQALESIEQEIDQAMQKGIEYLLNMKEETVEFLKSVKEKKIRNDDQEVEWVLKNSPIYWSFNNPLETHLGIDFFTTLLLNDKSETRSILIERAKLLQDCAPSIKDSATGFIYRSVRDKPALRPKIIEANLAFLKEQREKNGKEKPVEINIIGGGPGGLIRALVAGVKGEKAKLIEKRSRYTRSNMVTMNETPLLTYFGVVNRLKEKGKIDPLEGSTFSVKVKDLEETLVEIAEEIYDEEWRVAGEVVDILKDQEGRAACLVKTKGEGVLIPADLHVDATGARADIGKTLGVGTQKMAGTQYMIAMVTDKNFTPALAFDQKDDEFSWSYPLSVPGSNYALVQPSPQNQKEIQRLSDEKVHLAKEIRRNDDPTLKAALQKEIEALEEELNNLLHKTASAVLEKKVQKGDLQLIEPFKIELHQREEPSILFGRSLMMFSGDALATPDPKSGAGAGHAIRGGLVFSRVVDDWSQHLERDQIRSRFNTASQFQMDAVTEAGVQAREEISNEDPLATETYMFKNSVKIGAMDDSELATLQTVAAMKKYGTPINEEYKEELDRIHQKLNAFYQTHPKLRSSNKEALEFTMNFTDQLIR